MVFCCALLLSKSSSLIPPEIRLELQRVVDLAKTEARAKLGNVDADAAKVISLLPCADLRKLAIKASVPVFIRYTQCTVECHSFVHYFDSCEVHTILFLLLCDQAVFCSSTALSYLNDIPITHPPTDYNDQLRLLQQVEQDIKAMVVEDLDAQAEAMYENTVFPCIFERIKDTVSPEEMSVFHILYNRVRQCESPTQISLLVSWLQPPESLLDMLTYNMFDFCLSKYRDMIDGIPNSTLSDEELSFFTRKYQGKWPRKQAFVVRLCCSNEEFCEFIWRCFQNNVRG
jgi:hypothetical protein